MHRLVAIALCIAVTICAYADYRILYINTPYIVIGGKRLKTGDTFTENATIKWTSERQAMRVMDTASGRQRVFVAGDFSQAKASTLKAYLAKPSRLSTNAGKATNDSKPTLAQLLNDHFYVLDRLVIDTGVDTDANHYFFITYAHNGQDYTKAIGNHDGKIEMRPSTFSFSGRTPAGVIPVKVYYYDKPNDKVKLVADGMTVELLPEKL